MTTEILRADLRLRRVTIAVLAIAALVAIALVFEFQRWLLQVASNLPNAQLVVRVHHAIGFAAIGAGVCLLVLAGYAGRMANRVKKEARWPLSDARVLHDTPVRRDQAAAKIGRLLDITALALIFFAVATVVLSWYMLTH